MEKAAALRRTHLLIDAAEALMDVRSPQHPKKETGTT